MSENDGSCDIGALLEKTRNSKGVSLSSASVQTNLSVDILDKLESNRFSEVGPLVYTRGYLLKYVRFLGLDEASILEEFVKYDHRATEVKLNSANIASQSYSYRRYHYKTWAVLSIFFVVIALILWQVLDNRSWLMRQMEEAFQEDNQQEVPVFLASDIEVLQEDSFDVVEEVSDVPVEVLTLSSLQDVEDFVDESLQEAQEVQEEIQETPLEEALVDVAPLQLVFSGESWIEVRDKNNRVIASRTVQSGTIDLSFEDAPFSLNIGRPENVQLLISGQDGDLMAYRIGNTRRFRVDINHE